MRSSDHTVSPGPIVWQIWKAGKPRTGKDAYEK